jgi:hypothetical protein
MFKLNLYIFIDFSYPIFAKKVFTNLSIKRLIFLDWFFLFHPESWFHNL